MITGLQFYSDGQRYEVSWIEKERRVRETFKTLEEALQYHERMNRQCLNQ